MHSSETAKKIVDKINLENFDKLKCILDIVEQKFLDVLDVQIEFDVEEFNKILRMNNFQCGYGPVLKLLEQIGGYFCSTGSRPDPHSSYEGNNSLIDFIIIRIPSSIASEIKLDEVITNKVKIS